MERRRDYRHALRYTVSLLCPRSRRMIEGASTRDVSASGLRFCAEGPHGLAVGDRLEVSLVAPVGRGEGSDLLVMGTRARVVRAEASTGALCFDAPLAY